MQPHHHQHQQGGFAARNIQQATTHNTTINGARPKRSVVVMSPQPSLSDQQASEGARPIISCQHPFKVAFVLSLLTLILGGISIGIIGFNFGYYKV